MNQPKRQGGNQGEGNVRAARRYHDKLTESLDDEQGIDPTPDSRQLAKELEQAEEAGKRKARELDPQVHRNWNEAEQD